MFSSIHKGGVDFKYLTCYDTNMVTISIDEAAKRLNISKASIKNWEKHGYIERLGDSRYSEDEIDTLIERIRSGEIKRLGTRANKSRSRHRFIPSEYLSSKNSLNELENIVDFITEYNIRPQQALFLLSINLLYRSGEIEGDLYSAVNFEQPQQFRRIEVYNELKGWYDEVRSGKIQESNRFCKFLLEAPLPNERDLLGLIYQSIIFEGDKSTLGAYYTPRSVVKEMVSTYTHKLDKVLDPCCGTGQFLLELAEHIDKPETIWGCDIDPVAVRITKINLFLQYRESNFTPNIYCMDALKGWGEGDFSLIVTNPPWGSKIEKSKLEEIKKLYPMVESKESFSLFLAFANRFLTEGGVFTYVLPESLLFVKNHRDIRTFLLEELSLTFIESYGKIFKRVFSSVVRLDGVKRVSSVDHTITIKSGSENYSVKQQRFLHNHNAVIDIYCNNEDQVIIDRVLEHPHVTLHNRAKWALGIVTGNNGKFLSSEKSGVMEPIYRGKDLLPLKLDSPGSFIEFQSQKFQQCAPESIYRAEEKLIYKFISKDLVFAYDDKGCLTLNSANILIPQVDELEMKVVAAQLNSSIIRFIFRKKFNAIKILRGDIESLPLPLFTKEQQEELSLLVNRYLDGEIDFKHIDDVIFLFLDIKDEEKKQIVNFLNS